MDRANGRSAREFFYNARNNRSYKCPHFAGHLQPLDIKALP